MNDESSSLLPETGSARLQSLFERPSSTAALRPYESTSSESYLVPLEDDPKTTVNKKPPREPCIDGCAPRDWPSTTIGALTFTLYHVVFCLAQAATITRPSASHASTGLMAKTAAVGVLTAGPLFIAGVPINAIYPASDLFLAPFLAKLAERIDDVLAQQGLADDDGVFLATFLALTAVAFVASGLLCIAAARFKLANLGAFLPYQVLCGFFTAIGILMWTLGFNVDTGLKVEQVLQSRDVGVWQTSLMHHAPSLAIGIIMHWFGPSSPFLVILLVLSTILGSYGILWATSTTLAQATDAHWFYSVDDLIRPPSTAHPLTFGPPWPFGIWFATDQIYWPAARAGVPIIAALAVLYLIRCSLHSAAVRKNIPNVTRAVPETDSPGSTSERSVAGVVKRKAPSLGYILEHGYGYAQLAAAAAGGIAVAPSVAASLTLFKLGAEKTAPQYGSCLLVLVFYLTDFRLVQYIPKAAFSSLMVLAGLDMAKTWTVDSFRKTKNKTEWMVGPILVVMSFTLGMLNAIFLGVAVSTFVFAHNFYRAGTVKYVGTGLQLRSPVERGVDEARFLNEHADRIQILVLQHYLFFGNAQSVLTYVLTMFEDDVAPPLSPLENVAMPPKPKYLIVDFTMVSGMDTSAIDVFREIIDICRDNKCYIYLSGLGPDVRADLVYAGIKPPPGSKRFAFSKDLESALAKAEDGLVSDLFHLEERDKLESTRRTRMRSESNVDAGFVYALRKIDLQHDLHMAAELQDLAPYTSIIELATGDVLHRDDDADHGLYFIETGLMRVRHALGHSSFSHMSSGVGTNGGNVSGTRGADPTVSIGHMNARGATIGRQVAWWKDKVRKEPEQTFRLARIGQGWIIGGIEAANGMRNPGVHVAISQCRLYHLPRSAILKVEEENPRLAMNLYKLLSHLSTKRQEVTIQQLGQFIKILNTPPPRLRGGRSDLARLQYTG